MPLIPTRLPLWAYGAALGAGFAVSRLGSRPAAPPPEAPAGDEAPPAGTTGLWDAWGDGSGGSYVGSQGIGVLPAPYQGPGMEDYLDAPPIAPTPVPSEPLPAPAPAPAPTPTGTVIARPRTKPPTGAVGWTVVKVGQRYYNPAAGWNGAYPVKIGSVASYTSRTARWISGTKSAILSGRTISVRRVSHRDTVDGNWANDFVDAAVPIYSLSTTSVRV